MLSEGMPAKAVQEILGHSRISTTLDTYSRVTPNLLDDAANQLDAALGIQI
jgi:site-specific recombinase XerD